MSRKQPKRRAGRMASIAVAGFFILAVACGVGFGVASADSSDDVASVGAFGFNEATHEATSGVAAEQNTAASADVGTSGGLALVSPTERDITRSLIMADEREAAEEARAQVENAAAIKRVGAKKAMQGIGSSTSPVSEDNVVDVAEAIESGQIDEYNLPAVDWSVGKKAFVAEWTQRIDAYLAGTPLSGHGAAFAEAAWDNGVDPRWSPAISNTESGNGMHCFLPYNAWGWGSNSWPDWDTAINEHVAGLAAGYGYSVTFEAAQKYCPPNCVHWYNNTLSQMALI